MTEEMKGRDASLDFRHPGALYEGAFKGIGNWFGSLFGLLAEMDQANCSAIVRQGEISDSNGELKGSYRLGIGIGIDNWHRWRHSDERRITKQLPGPDDE